MGQIPLVVGGSISTIFAGGYPSIEAGCFFSVHGAGHVFRKVRPPFAKLTHIIWFTWLYFWDRT